MSEVVRWAFEGASSRDVRARRAATRDHVAATCGHVVSTTPSTWWSTC